jgi:hypothetical protein
MLQNKTWGGKIATSYFKSTTPVGGGRQPRRGSRGWLGRTVRRAANPRRLGEAASASGHPPNLSLGRGTA